MQMTDWARTELDAMQQQQEIKVLNFITKNHNCIIFKMN